MGLCKITHAEQHRNEFTSPINIVGYILVAIAGILFYVAAIGWSDYDAIYDDALMSYLIYIYIALGIIGLAIISFSFQKYCSEH